MRNILFMLAVGLIVVACSKNDPVSPVDTGIKAPVRGSVFEYNGYGTDLGGIKIPSSDYTALETINATGLVYGGKTGVWSSITTDKASGTVIDTTYSCFDERKDILLNSPDMSVDGTPRWLRLPVTTGVTAVDSAVTSDSYGGIPITLALKVKSERVGEESILVGTKTIATKKIVITSTVSISALGQLVDSFSFKQTIWFAPSLGMLVQRATEAYEVGGEVEDGDYAKLVSYTIP
ncbi:MAG: hypothetical protein FGM33_06945 [Candidatus Kapabacteria bacterium]|nr:hypothetical protein [Candidatus Kapabacteria bacterium]